MEQDVHSNNKVNLFLINFQVAVGIYVYFILHGINKRQALSIDYSAMYISLYDVSNRCCTAVTVLYGENKKKKRGEEDGIDLFLRLVADVALRLPHWRGNTWRRHFDTIDEVRMRFQYDRKTSHTAHNTIEKI